MSKSDASIANSSRISLATLGWYLIGDRKSILQLAQCRGGLWLGFVFVFSAGFAREYDGEYLVREPWHLLIPFFASLVSSFILYLVICGTRCRNGGFWLGYRRLLTLFWLTAPLAWLYAVPFERFSSAPDSVAANLWLLSIVSVWRVVLMIRVVSVLYKEPWYVALFLVMLFADVVAVVAITAMPRPIINVMGGIRQTESEQLILAVTFFVQFLGVMSLPIWLIGWAVVAQRRWKSVPDETEPALPDQQSNGSVSRDPWLLAAFSIIIWIPILPQPQSEQKNRWKVTQDLSSGRYEDAVRYMSDRSPADFPPHWDPPPRPGYGEVYPPLSEILDAVFRFDAADWVRDIYLDKLRMSSSRFDGAVVELRLLDDDQLRRYRDLLLELSDGRKIARSHEHYLEDALRVPVPGEVRPPPELSTERRELLQAIQDLTKEPQDKKDWY